MRNFKLGLFFAAKCIYHVNNTIEAYMYSIHIMCPRQNPLSCSVSVVALLNFNNVGAICFNSVVYLMYILL